MVLWRPEGCCCINLRRGTIILGGLWLIGGFVWPLLEFSFLFVAQDNHSYVWQLWRDLLVYRILTLVVSLVQIALASLLLHGVRTKRPSLMVPMMVLNLCLIIVQVILSVMVGVLALVRHRGSLCTLLFGILTSSLAVYFLLVVRAYYLQLKEEKKEEEQSKNEARDKKDIEECHGQRQNDRLALKEHIMALKERDLAPPPYHQLVHGIINPSMPG